MIGIEQAMIYFVDLAHRGQDKATPTLEVCFCRLEHQQNLALSVCVLCCVCVLNNEAPDWSKGGHSWGLT